MKRALMLATMFLLACSDDNSDINEPQVAQLDQQNLLDGTVSDQSIGRFVEEVGDQAPDHQSAQTFTVGMAGRLTRVRVPLINLDTATAGATMDIVATTSVGVPDESRKLGEASIPTSAMARTSASRTSPDSWASFDFTNANINVTAGQRLAFILRSTSTKPINYATETTSGYAQGSGFRRNRVATANWMQGTYDYLFQTYVLPQ
jgi:hypothetical protein